jgi:hypothetical protein
MSSGRRAVCHDVPREPSLSVFSVVCPDLEPVIWRGADVPLIVSVTAHAGCRQ